MPLVQWLHRHQWQIFSVALGVVVLTSLIQMVLLRGLYLDSVVRADARELTKQVAEQNGLLLSGMRIVAANRETITLCYRLYQRGVDPKRCQTFFFGSLPPQP